MKRVMIIVLIGLSLILTGCKEQVTEIDCEEFPTHETCISDDDKVDDIIVEDTCETNPDMDKCKDVPVDCEEDPDNDMCIVEEITTCEEESMEDCVFQLAIAESDGTYELINTYEFLTDAQKVMKDTLDDNVVVLGENDKVLGMKYGAVNFKTKSVYDVTILGHVDFRHPTYINGNYNIDGLYLGSNGLFVNGVIAGVHFEVNAAEVELIPHIQASDGYSYYLNVDGELIHKISYGIKQAAFVSIGAIDISPDYLTSDQKYYSYDNHYFYTDIKEMTDDFNDGVFDNSMNEETPYYNYYQTVSFRTLTNYTAEELNEYINSNVSTNSGLYNSGEGFIKAGEDVYINAAMEMSFAIHESGWGNSWIARNKNNFFGIDAYDSDPNGSAKTFETVEDCIEYHASYLLGSRYFNPEYYVSFGTNFGNKYQGMNYKYASDAFWGVKIAKHYYNLDKALGFKDRNSYQIVLLKPDAIGYYGPTTDSPVIYDPSSYTYKGLYIPFVVKKEREDFISLFLPIGLNDDFEMDIDEVMNINDVFYVSIEDVIKVN